MLSMIVRFGLYGRASIDKTPRAGELGDPSIGGRDVGIRGAWAYQSSGIGAVETEESHGRLDLAGGGGGGIATGLGVDNPRGAEKGLSRQHDGRVGYDTGGRGTSMS